MAKTFKQYLKEISDQQMKDMSAGNAYNGGKSIPKQKKKAKAEDPKSQERKDAAVAKMDAEDKAARKAQADKFAAMKNESVNESEKDTHCSDKCCGAEVKREDCKCSPDCKHCNCNDPKVAEGKSPHAKGTKKYKKHMAAIHAEGVQDTYKLKIAERLNNKLGK